MNTKSQQVWLLVCLGLVVVAVITFFGWRYAGNRTSGIVATVVQSPDELGSQAAENREYVLKGEDGKTYHISTLQGENSLPADAIETCISLTGLKLHDKIRFALHPSPTHQNTSNDIYYNTCYEGHKNTKKYYIEPVE